MNTGIPEPAPVPRPARTPSEARRHRFTIVLFVSIIGLAGLGFCVKIHEFVEDWLSQNGVHFGGSHLLSYGLTAAGYACLLAFAYLRGHFADIERPKYDLLDSEELRDRTDFA